MAPVNLATGSDLLAALLPEWQLLLQGWSTSGQLTAAAREALVLKDEPPELTDLVTQWSAGNFNALPPIVLLPSADMNGAMGAYAISTGTIYLNADWLAGATKDPVFVVLTEELGHHLDWMLSAVDTQGGGGGIDLYFPDYQTKGTQPTEEILPNACDKTMIFTDDSLVGLETGKANRVIHQAPHK